MVWYGMVWYSIEHSIVEYSLLPPSGNRTKSRLFSHFSEHYISNLPPKIKNLAEFDQSGSNKIDIW